MMTIEYWTTADALNGLCEMEDVGDVRETERIAPPTPAPGPMYQPMTRAERKVKLQSVVDKIIHYADAHPEAMLDDNGAQINKLMDLFSKMDEREEEKAPSLDKLTASDLAKLSLTDLKRVLIDVVLKHVPEDRREAALQMLR